MDFFAAFGLAGEAFLAALAFAAGLAFAGDLAFDALAGLVAFAGLAAGAGCRILKIKFQSDPEKDTQRLSLYPF